MIRNLVFDMGNVLVTFDPELFMDREGLRDPEDRRIVRRELFQSVEWSMMDLGLLSEKEVEPRVISRVPDHLKASVTRLLYEWPAPRTMVPGMEALVRRLKDRDYPLYLLSNASVMQPSYWKTMPVSSLFEGTLISAEVKLVKPMPEIYHALTERFHLQPEECLFIDDNSMNVAAAVWQGWEGIVFHGDAAELECRLKQLGVRL